LFFHRWLLMLPLLNMVADTEVAAAAVAAAVAAGVARPWEAADTVVPAVLAPAWGQDLRCTEA
jgi:hypothetical protein